MPEEQDKNQGVKDEPAKAEQVEQELSDEVLEVLSGGLMNKEGDFKASEPYMV